MTIHPAYHSDRDFWEALENLRAPPGKMWGKGPGCQAAKVSGLSWSSVKIPVKRPTASCWRSVCLNMEGRRPSSAPMPAVLPRAV